MVCSADELVVWRDFPKGLRVLLLDEDCNSAEETRLKLEAMDYIVFSFQNEKDALEAVLKKADSFHVAIVEMTTQNSSGSFRFLELAKDLPTVVISDVRSLSMMMKCIALGAAEFLEKPLSEDKLRNIWQHVVHKAFNAGADILSESLKPVKETVSSILQLQQETSEPGIEVLFEIRHEMNDMDNDNQNFGTGERFSAPSTPQLEQGERLLDGGDYHDQPNCSHETETTESKVNCIDLVKQKEDNSSESKSVENTCISLANLDNKKDDSISIVKEVVCDEVDSANGSKMDVESLRQESNNKDKVISVNSRSHGKRGNRKRMKVDWTAELHRQFVQAVEQLGIDQAIPSKILELMNVEGLTRHNVASHLQKFRMQRRHILPKDEHRRWQPNRDPFPRNYMPKPPIFPPFHSNYGFPPQQVYPVWGHPSYLQSAFPMWGNTSILPWQPPPQNWPQKTYPGIHADAWGCPTVPPYNQYNFSSHIQSSINGLDVRERSKGSKDPYDGIIQIQSSINGLDVRERSKGSKDPYDVNQQAEEMVDQVLGEAMSKTWLPLPLGLKPPSVDGVLAELHRQGIRTIPPTSRR